MDYFKLFNIPTSLQVNKSDLLKKYYQLSRELHPDNFSLADDAAQEKSLIQTSELNKAKTILDNSFLRLEYILLQKNIIQTDDKYVLSPLFLNEIMELNEELEDVGSNQEEIKSKISSFENELEQTIQPFFLKENLDTESVNWELLKEYYYKKKYLMRIAEQFNSY